MSETDTLKGQLATHLNIIYGDNINDDFIEKCVLLLQNYRDRIPLEEVCTWDEKDIVLITYGDTVTESWQRPLLSLRYFMNKYLKDCVSTVHLLPFYAGSYDNGFSVIDYHKVDDNLGTWGDVRKINTSFKLMFDLEINHVSAKSEWFRQFLEDEPPGKNYFIVPGPSYDLSRVTWSGNSPPLTSFRVKGEEKKAWTTFSGDKIDLNFRNPTVFLEILKVLLHYMEEGARIIRLEGMAFVWKESGTNCLNLPQTHELVKLFRVVTEYVAPGSLLLLKTIYSDNKYQSYCGEENKVHLVHQDNLPLLLLHALYTGKSEYLTNWARSIPELPRDCTFLNFTASDDGIGLSPPEDVLPPEEAERLVEGMIKNGGLLKTEKDESGKDVPLELNISYFDALNKDVSGDSQHHMQRFVCSQLIMFALKGIPAIYIHSMLATPNFSEGVEETGTYRTINNRKWDMNELERLLKEDPLHSGVFNLLRKCLHKRRGEKAFHPRGEQEIPDSGSNFFVIVRTYEERQVVCISNVTGKKQTFSHFTRFADTWYIDMLSARRYSRDKNNVILDPYQTVWLTTI